MKYWQVVIIGRYAGVVELYGYLKITRYNLTMLQTVESPFRVLITGVSGGTGGSTTATKTAERLHLPLISGGRYFRAFTQEFALFQTANARTSPELQYQQFLDLYSAAYARDGFKGIEKKISRSIGLPHNTERLQTFSALIDERRKVGIFDTVWDLATDEMALNRAFTKRPGESKGFVWEAKLAILALHIKELQEIIVEQEEFALPFLKVLLTLPSAVAAERINTREGTQLTALDIEEQKRENFARYQLYHINEKSIVPQDLFTYADVEISTEFNDPDTVVHLLLAAYMQKLLAAIERGNSEAEYAFLELEAALAA